ncbi:PepSY domain-containing protein [Microvirga mediterraneensis]|uniref:PepSY domain-containing protein n=1 Tax=Microvirga mediterraneensis TaxID=2754695 RepID=A0A838BT42_9HYPH|nr:PepSY domain-containing protein [Microvirga mediterraneensis]MBA1158994.1 PepSY domain-containing protein [Microvirga mediterraneensis]
MRRLGFATLAVLSTLATAAVAQSTNTQGTGSSTAQPTNSGASNPAVTHKPADSPQSTGTVEPGSNSFTEEQARSRIEAQGFRNVAELRKDDQGIWRGKAERDGKSVSVAVDYKGTVQAQ